MRHWDGYSWAEGEGDGRKGGWIQTYAGRKFWPLDPRLEDIDIRDIAHHLSLQCRFSGACRYHYSVAQHSVLVAGQVAMLTHNPVDLMWALLHDAPEAYLVDLPRPLKHSPGFEAYADIEDNLMRVVCRYVGGLPFGMPEVVERADRIMLATERRDLLGPDCHWEVPGVEPQGHRLLPWAHQHAEDAYLAMYNRLQRKLQRELARVDV